MAIASPLIGIQGKLGLAKGSQGNRKRAVVTPATVRCSANAQLEVFNKGRGRAVIVGARKNSAPADALEAWLAERIDVVRFDRHAGSGEFYVDYDDGIALPGRFIRRARRPRCPEVS